MKETERLSGLRFKYDEWNIATSLEVDVAVPRQKTPDTISAEIRRTAPPSLEIEEMSNRLLEYDFNKLVVKNNGEKLYEENLYTYGDFRGIEILPEVYYRNKLYDAVMNEVNNMLQKYGVQEKLPTSLEEYIELYGATETQLPNAKYIQYKDMKDIGDSLMLSHGEKIAELIAPDGRKAVLGVTGTARVTTLDENGKYNKYRSFYDSFDKMPKEMQEKIKDGSYHNDEKIYVVSRNNFELFWQGTGNFKYVDIGHNTPEQICKLMAEWINELEDREYNHVPESFSDYEQFVPMIKFNVYKDIADINAFMAQLNNDGCIATLGITEERGAFLNIKNGSLEVSYQNYERGSRLLAKRAIELEMRTPEEIYQKIAEVVNDYENKTLVPPALDSRSRDFVQYADFTDKKAENTEKKKKQKGKDDYGRD